MSVKKILENVTNGDLIEEEIVNREGEIQYMYSRVKDLLDTPSCRLKPGQIVKWKPGLRNRSFPIENAYSVVVEVLDEPLVTNDKKTGSAYFKERIDVQLAVMHPSDKERPLDKNPDITMYWFDSRRFEVVDIEGLDPFEEQDDENIPV